MRWVIRVGLFWSVQPGSAQAGYPLRVCSHKFAVRIVSDCSDGSAEQNEKSKSTITTKMMEKTLAAVEKKFTEALAHPMTSMLKTMLHHCSVVLCVLCLSLKTLRN